jgi:hypothetical protein
VKKYTEITDETEITLEASRHWPHQAVHWLITTLIVLFDGSFMGEEPPMDLVVRDRRTGKKVYTSGPFTGAEAVNEAQEAARVIRALGIQGYVDRERR